MSNENISCNKEILKLSEASKFNSFKRAFKAEWLKNNHFSLGLMTLFVALASVLFVTLVSEFTAMKMAQLGAQTNGKNLFVKSYAEIVSFHLFFFLGISYPFINALLASRSYRIEFANNMKRSLYTQPVSRFTVFLSKLAFGLAYNALALIFLFAYILIFTGRYIELYEPNLAFSFSHILNMLLICVYTLIITIPILSLHIFLSARKVPQLWNSIILLGLTYFSLYLYVDKLTNQWYNFFIYPFTSALHLSVSKGASGIFSEWYWFAQYSPAFVLLMSLAFSSAAIYLLYGYFRNKDAKY